MKIILYDQAYLPTAELSEDHLIKFQNKFTASNPKFFFNQKSGYSTHNVKKNIEMFTMSDGYLIVPIGMLATLTELLKWYDYHFEIVDRRVPGVPIDYIFGDKVVLEDYQTDVVETMLKSPTCNGLIQSPPGSGKSVMALNLISRLKLKTLIIVHEMRLMRQWVSEANKHGVGNFKVSEFSGDGHDFGDITIMLIQSGYRYRETYPEFQDFGCIIVDECHHASSSTFSLFLNRIPTKYKFGMSGTLQRKDRMNFLLEYFLGPKLIEVPVSKTRNRITDFNVSFVETKVPFTVPFNTPDGKPPLTKKGKRDLMRVSSVDLLETLTGFKGSDTYPSSITDEEIIALGLTGRAGERNKVIMENVIQDIKVGHIPIILTNRKLHARFIHAYLIREGYNGIIFTGETTANYDIDEIRESPVIDGKRISYLVATERIAAEALDITYLSSLHVLIPSTNEHKLKQCLGRIRRRASDKLDPIVRDYVDMEDAVLPGEEDYFARSAKKRKSYYLEWKSDYSNPELLGVT